MKLGIVRETFEGERRVIATPEAVEKWVAAGHEVWVEQGAGDRCSASDAAYESAGAKVVDTATAWTEPELILKVHAPNDTEIDRLPEGRALISLVYPAQNSELIQRWKQAHYFICLGLRAAHRGRSRWMCSARKPASRATVLC